MQTIKFTNSAGVSLTFGVSEPFILQGLSGTGGIPADVQRQKAPFQDGTTYIDTRLEDRPLDFTITIRGANQQDVYDKRKQLADLFNPKLGEGELIYTNDFISKRLNCVVDLAPVFPPGPENQWAGTQLAQIALLATQPFWEDVTATVVKMEDFVKLFTLPFTLPTVIGSQADVALIDNQGSVETPLEIEFRGPATAPLRITNETTGEFVEVEQSLLAEEKLVINTSTGEKTVTFIDSGGVETSAFNLIDLASTFFQLQVGENEIRFTTGGGTPEVFLTYRQRFVGL